MLSVSSIYKGFDGLGVLEGVSLDVGKGEVVAIIGPSGSGKSTLLRCVNQLERVDAGEIRLEEDRMCWMEGDRLCYAQEETLRRITLRMGMVFQGYNLFPHRTVLQNLMDAPMAVKKTPKKQALEQAMALLQKVGLEGKASAVPCQLSGGQAQRVAIARALCMDPEILCFDEPTSALDPELTQEVLAVMRDLAKERMTMLVVTHEMAFARDVADRIILMGDGLIVDQGAPEALFTSNNPRTRKFLGM